MKTAAEILLDLVAIPSVSVLANQPVIDYACSYFDGKHWSIELHPHVDANGTPKTNLVAITKNSDGQSPELTLVCHTDTVPFETGWQAAVQPEIRNGLLYGRGSCDVKGFLACVLKALSSIDLTRLRKPLAVVLTADEEVGCVGAKCLVAKSAVHCRFMIIGEPTSLQPVRAGKGYALAEIVVEGREAHSAFPERGRSAITDGARVVLMLEQVAKTLTEFRDDAFDPPYTTLNVGVIQGGTAKNIVPGECHITVEWRPIPAQEPEFTAGLIEQGLSELASAHPELKARLNIQRMDPAFKPSPTVRLSELIQRLSKRTATTIAFGSEAAHFRSASDEIIVFGPGDMTVAHKTGEFVPLSELDECVDCLRAVVLQLCG